MSQTRAALTSDNASGRVTTSATRILVNPRSFRVNGKGQLDSIQRRAAATGVPVHVVEEPEDIAGVLSENASREAQTLVVIGGDGTLQALASALADVSGTSAPKVLALGGGRTNFTARDLGTDRRLDQLLERALTRPQGWRVALRPVLALEHPHLTAPLYGFFVAAALVDHLIRDCHRYRTRHRGWLRTGHPSSAWRVAQLALLGMVGRHHFEPPQARVEAGSLGSLQGSLRLLIATSLEHAEGWLDPYAKRGQGTLRVTAVSASAHRFWGRLPSLLRGSFRDGWQPGNGYLSGRTDQLRLRGLNTFCIDGQEFELDPTEEIIVRAGPDIHFLVP